jgi:hypothetical protein
LISRRNLMKRVIYSGLLLGAALVSAGCAKTDTDKPEAAKTDVQPVEASTAAQPGHDAKAADIWHTMAGAMGRAVWKAATSGSTANATPEQPDNRAEAPAFAP